MGGKITSDCAPSENMVGWLRHVLFLGVGPDRRVRSERELADGGNIGRRGEQLEGGLLLRVSDVDGDLGGTKVLQGRGGIVGVFYPLDSLRLPGLPRGGSGRGGGLHSFGVGELVGRGEKARKNSHRLWQKPRARRRPRPIRE